MKKTLSISLSICLLLVLGVIIVYSAVTPSPEEVFRNAVTTENLSDFYERSWIPSETTVLQYAQDHPALLQLLELHDLDKHILKAGMEVLEEYRTSDNNLYSLNTHVILEILAVLYPAIME